MKKASQARESRRGRPVTQETALRRALAILARPMPWGTEVAPCHCHGCEAARAKPFRCRFCGFHGVPFVYPCECSHMKPDAVTTFGEGLRRMEETGHEQDAAWYRRELAQLLTEGPKPCAIDGRRQECCHTHAECPVCFAAGAGWTDSENALHAWRMIRAVRRLLEQATREPGAVA